MQTATYQLTAGDLADARIYVHERLPAVRILKLTILMATFSGLVLGAYLAMRGDWDAMKDLVGWLGAGVLMIVWPHASNRWLVPISVRKQLANSKGMQGEIIASWNDDLIHFESGYGQSKWPWNDLFKWQESPGGLLLWSSDRTTFACPSAP